MRKFYLLFACCLTVALLALVRPTQAQTISNAGLESWSAGEPASWLTSNSPPTFINVTQSNQAHSGTSAAQGRIDTMFGFGVPAVLSAGPDGQGFPISARPAALRGWYKFTGVGGDNLLIISVFAKNGVGIGGGSFATGTSTATYREFYANTVWTTAETPDTAFIVVQIGPGGGTMLHAGTTFWVDDFVYGSTGDVREDAAGIPNNFSLHQNYPNPFNPSTKIRYEIPKMSSVSLKVFNMIGQEVATLVKAERTAGVYVADFSAANLPSGTYFYRLQAGDFSAVKKLVLLK